MLGLHKWTVLEDITVATYAFARKTDPKTIKKLSLRMHISESKIAFRMSNYTKLIQNQKTDWHCSAQERKVFDWLLSSNVVKVLPTI